MDSQSSQTALPTLRSRFVRGMGRNVFILGLVSLFTDISSEMLYPVVPLFLTGVLHAPMDVLGLIEGIAECTASLLKMVSGWWSDKIGRRTPFVIWGYSVSAVSKPLLFLAATWHWVLASRLIDRLGKGLRTSPRDVMIAAACVPEQRGKAFGFHRAMDTVGACIGPLLAVLMLSVFKWEFKTIFLWAFIPALLGVLCFFLLQRKPNDRAGQELRAIRHDAGHAPLGAGLKRFIFIYAVFAIGNSSDVFLIMRAKDVGFTPSMAIMTYVLYNFIYALAATPAGWLSDRVDRRKLMAGGFAVFALVYGGFALVGHASMGLIWVLFGFYGVYAACTEGIAKAYVTDLSPASRRGTAMGLMQTVTGLTAFVASFVAGLLWKKFGAPATFYYGAGCALAAAGLFFVVPQPSKHA